MVGLLDTYPPGPRQQASWRDRVRIHAANMSGNGLLGALAYLGRMFGRMTNKVIHDLSGKSDLLKNIFSKLIPQTFRNATLNSFNLRPYDGDVTLYKVSERPWYVNWDPMANWLQYLPGKFKIVDIPGSHMSLLSKPNVEAVSRAICESLLERRDDGF
jgi:thioesterase domain-containing protein